MPITAATTNAPASTHEVSTAEVRAWAREHDIEVPDRGRLRSEMWQRYRDAHGGPCRF